MKVSNIYLEEHKLFPDILLDHVPPDLVTMIETYYWRYMDDGNALLPKCVDSDLFLHCMNSLHPNINVTLEPARRIVINGRTVQCLDFLDITIVLFDDNHKVETDIHYK